MVHAFLSFPPLRPVNAILNSSFLGNRNSDRGFDQQANFARRYRCIPHILQIREPFESGQCKPFKLVRR